MKNARCVFQISKGFKECCEKDELYDKNKANYINCMISFCQNTSSEKTLKLLWLKNEFVQLLLWKHRPEARTPVMAQLTVGRRDRWERRSDESLLFSIQRQQPAKTVHTGTEHEVASLNRVVVFAVRNRVHDGFCAKNVRRRREIQRKVRSHSLMGGVT